MILEGKSVPAQIVDAIRREDCAAIARLLQDNPEQLSAYTPFGGQTWLGYAAQLGKLAASKKLVSCGVDVNRGDKFENGKPICSAAANNHLGVAAYLLSAGAVMDVSLSVRNPLFAAIVGRSPDIVRLLLKAGIDSKARYSSETMRDMDAVAFALMRGEAECARVIALWNSNGDEEMAALALNQANLVGVRNAFASDEAK